MSREGIPLLLFLIIPGSVAHAVTVFSHIGASNPTDGSWMRTAPLVSAETISGGTIDDLGSGIDAYFVGDGSTVHNSVHFYSQTPDSATIAEASATGWKLSVNMRISSGNTGNAPSMGAGYEDGSAGFEMYFDRESDGDPTVGFRGGASTYTLDGVGDSTYNLYEMIYDSNSGTADLYVNGVERLSDFAGSISASPRVRWGSVVSNGTGNGYFNSVTFATGSFSVIPEPQQVAGIFALTALGVVISRRRLKGYTPAPRPR